MSARSAESHQFVRSLLMHGALEAFTEAERVAWERVQAAELEAAAVIQRAADEVALAHDQRVQAERDAYRAAQDVRRAGWRARRADRKARRGPSTDLGV
jgi:hypothetical protein